VASFAHQPAGCTSDESCTMIRALIFSYEGSTEIAAGAVVYFCTARIEATW
jgi:hypothetical protein